MEESNGSNGTLQKKPKISKDVRETLDRYGLTRTEAAILHILKDGLPHKARDIHEQCCGPSSYSVLAIHVSNIRRKIPAHFEILCVARDNTSYYQWVRKLVPVNDGRR